MSATEAAGAREHRDPEPKSAKKRQHVCNLAQSDRRFHSSPFIEWELCMAGVDDATESPFLPRRNFEDTTAATEGSIFEGAHRERKKEKKPLLVLSVFGYAISRSRCVPSI